jgi:hypothetical protein
MDAIIVPTARPASQLTHAMDLAAEHGCQLLVLSSKRSSARAAAAQATEFGVRLVAIDVAGNVGIDGEDAAVGPLASFVTSNILKNTRFHSGSDLSFKRNLGLTLARMAGWDRVLFLDDDMHNLESQAVSDAAHLLDAFDIVGLQNNGFPDNSVLCHAYRATGRMQDTFIGGGALAVATYRVHSFFPNVYNEDWLFMLPSVAGGRAAVTGTAKQETYDPFASPRRARYEEFGDCLAEGLFYLLDTEGRIDGADASFWQRFILDRRDLIIETGTALREHSGNDQRCARTLEALRASWKSNVRITPQMYVQYLAGWRADANRWNEWLGTLDRFDGIEKTLAELGLAFHVPPMPEVQKPIAVGRSEAVPADAAPNVGDTPPGVRYIPWRRRNRGRGPSEGPPFGPVSDAEPVTDDKARRAVLYSLLIVSMLTVYQSLSYMCTNIWRGAVGTGRAGDA